MSTLPTPDPTFPIGIDIGGTKCAVSQLREGRVVEYYRTPTGPFSETWSRLLAAVGSAPGSRNGTVGISCGGPLDAVGGRIFNPPNLSTDWHRQELCRLLQEQLGGSATLMNDANACALAEWRFGAGRGTRNFIFLTAGTGMGAGLILDGRLYEGSTGDAGEIGHVRLRNDGPVGYGKSGSVEGFTSGGALPQLARHLANIRGVPLPAWIGPATSAKDISLMARSSDAFAQSVIRTAGQHLGETIAILIDLFNPDVIALGGIYPRCRDLLDPTLIGSVANEALSRPARHCRILPSELGETIGSHGAIAVATYQRTP